MTTENLNMDKPQEVVASAPAAAAPAGPASAAAGQPSVLARPQADAPDPQGAVPQGTEKTASAEQQVPPQLPDGWGIDLEQFRGLLAMKHKTIVAEDDPILMVGTLINVGTFEFDRMLKKHDMALRRLFIDETKKYLEVAEEVSEVLSSTSAKAVQDVFRRHSLTMNTLRTQLWWMIGVAVFTTLINLAAVMVK